jgi:tripartite-type tricarboxylate transporter receptor subunit TctC
VPFPPGGSPDVLARALAVQLDAQLGKSVIVDNRGGANGIIGAEIVARAARDGYTSEEFRQFVQAEIKRYAAIVREANIRVE